MTMSSGSLVPSRIPRETVAETSTAKMRCRTLRRALKEHSRSIVRDAILDAAEEVFCQHGQRAARIASIAQIVGVAVGTVYNHFDSKDALFFALKERCAQRYSAALGVDYCTSDPIEQLELFVKRSLGYVEDNRQLYLAGLYDVEASTNGKPHPSPSIEMSVYREVNIASLRTLLSAAAHQGRLDNGVDVDELVWALHSLLQAAVTSWGEAPVPYSLCVRGQALLRLLLQGALRRELDEAELPIQSPGQVHLHGANGCD